MFEVMELISDTSNHYCHLLLSHTLTKLCDSTNTG